MFEFYSNFENQIITNTTIGAVLTNANFDKTHMTKVAQMAQTVIHEVYALFTPLLAEILYMRYRWVI